MFLITYIGEYGAIRGVFSRSGDEPEAIRYLNNRAVKTPTDERVIRTGADALLVRWSLLRAHVPVEEIAA